MNEGFKYAQKFNPNFVLTLNDDVEVSNTYVYTLIKDFYSLSKERAIIGSMSISIESPSKILFSGIHKDMNKYKPYFPVLKKEIKSNIKGIHKTTELPGRGIIIPNKILLELNYFDDLFPQYGSDTDFCFRARKEGVEVFVSWNAQVKVNLKTTRIRSQSGINSFKIKIQDLFNIHSHKSISKFINFNGRHYGYISLIWMLQKYLIKHFFID